VRLQTLDAIFLLIVLQTQLSPTSSLSNYIVYVSSYSEKIKKKLEKEEILFKNWNIWLEIKFNLPVPILAVRTGLDESYWVTDAAADQ
jgi:hypothetical protein